MGGFFQPSVVQHTSGGIPEEYKPYAREAAEFLRSRLGESGPEWQGPWTAPMSPQEEAALGGMESFYGTAYPMQPAAVEGWGTYLGGLSLPATAGEELEKTLSGAYLPGANQYLSDIEAGLRQRFDDALAEAQQRLAMAGHGGGSTAGAVLASRAAKDYLSTLGQLRLGAYEAERERMTRPQFFELPANMLTQGMQYPVATATALFGAGALPRTLAQQDIDKEYQEMLRLWNETYRAAGMAGPIFGAQQTTSTQYGPSPFMSLITGILPFFLPKP